MRELDILKEKSQNFNIDLTDIQLEKFKKYLELLQEFNKHTNLVSSAETETVIIKHFLDSLAIGLLVEKIDPKEKLNFIDIGIGGGFPGIPILIAFENWKLCAVDSVGKKSKFIKILSEELAISDRIEIITARAEDIAHNSDKREFFDFAVTRAVAKLNIISEYCLPFVKKGGYFVAYKSLAGEDELCESGKALSILGGEHVSTVGYTLTGEEQRNLILIQKIETTPWNYPRKTGIPKKKPL